MFFKKDKGCVFDLLIVGLGNPGSEYESTRHNVGFRAADKVCEEFSATLGRLKHKSLISECRISGKRVLVAKPQTYMNLSGESVAEICRFYKIPVDRILVIFDDVSLPVGMLRIRRSGSHGGHNGMKNISEHLSTNDIMRIKIGVGEKPTPEYDLRDWVLGKFQSGEDQMIAETLGKVAFAVKEILTAGVQSAMNKYNG